MSMEGGGMTEIGEMLQQRHGTRIGRIFTDPCLSASSAQSVFYRIPPIIYDDKKPQMKTPRVTPLEGVYTYACGHTWVRSREPAGFRHDERRYVHALGFGEIIHRKGRKERKAMQQESLRPLRSLRLNVFSTPAHEHTPQPALAGYLLLGRAGDEHGGWEDDVGRRLFGELGGS
ncbi:MAG: hypothetical protein Q8M95_04450 [Candidatus Methanoperedens sp.]|nr:hypothetical protein [Candidatus Methanoperedens sp.]